MIKDVLDYIWDNVSHPILLQLGIPTEKPMVKYTSHAVLFFLVVTVFFLLNLLAGSFTLDDDDEDGKGKRKKVSGSSTAAQKKADKQSFKGLAIVGASGSGKTTLFYQLMTGEFRETVSSLEENHTGKGGAEICKLKNSEGQTVERTVECVDIPGHYNFRERIQEVANSDVQGFILVVDSKDRKKLAESAEILYDIINNLNVLDRKVPILVACNKQDHQYSRRAAVVQNEFEREIDEIRKVRRATQDDQDTDMQNVTKSGYLEQINKTFKFSDAELRRQLPSVQFVEISIKKEQLSEIHKFITNLF